MSTCDNRSLLEATLRSHVQIKQSYSCDCPVSQLLTITVMVLERQVDKLWDADIPAMICAYFTDIGVTDLALTMTSRAQVMMVVGDSRYAGIRVDVAGICAEMAPAFGFKVLGSRPIRAMRASAQQGGRHVLSETLLHLERIN
jgi:hypothetical protein